jgi:hypothetical protein
MTATPNQAGPKRSRITDRNLPVKLGLPGPEAILAITEHTREVVQRSFGVANQVAAAFNRSFIDLVQRNVISGFDLAKNISEAKNLAEVVELQATYWQRQFGLSSQAKLLEVLPSLGISVAADLGAPMEETPRMKDKRMRSRDDVKVVSVVNTNLRKQKSSDKKSTALAQSKIHRKTSGKRSAHGQPGTIKRTSAKVVRQPLKGKK